MGVVRKVFYHKMFCNLEPVLQTKVNLAEVGCEDRRWMELALNRAEIGIVDGRV
jgi:hypothetical protein